MGLTHYKSGVFKLVGVLAMASLIGEFTILSRIVNRDFSWLKCIA